MTVQILSETPKNPLTIIGQRAGICCGADISNDELCRKRAIDCIKFGHNRVLEYIDVHMILDNISARVAREWYTHIGGSPTRLQESTRYVDGSNFKAVIPPSINKSEKRQSIYFNCLNKIKEAYAELTQTGVPIEDCAMLLPLGMVTRLCVKHNVRNLADMSRQRMCARAYWEYRDLFNEIKEALSSYSAEWSILVPFLFYSKCEETGSCKERFSCGRFPKK